MKVTYRLCRLTRTRLRWQIEINARGSTPTALANFGDHSGKYATTYIKLCNKPHETRFSRFDQIVEYTVSHRFMKCALIAVRPDIKFQAFQLDAIAVGHIVKIERCKIRLTGFRTETGKFRYFHVNPIITGGCRIRKSCKMFDR